MPAVSRGDNLNNVPMTEVRPRASAGPPFAMKIGRLVFALLCRLSPSLATKWADRLFFTPHSVKRPESELAYYRSAEKSSFAFNGQMIALYQWGQGDEAVLLAHGWGSRGTRLGPLVGPLIEAGYRVVTVDFPAHGDSGGKMTNLLEITQLLSRLCERFAPVKALVAHSFGGMATLAAIHKFDLDVKRAAIIAAPFTMEFIFESFSDQLGLTRQVRARLVTAIVERFEKTRNVQVFDYSPDRYAHTLQIPFLVFHDKGDREVAYEQGLRLSSALPNVEFVSTEGLGHRRIFRDPEVVRKVVEFVSQ